MRKGRTTYHCHKKHGSKDKPKGTKIRTYKTEEAAKRAHKKMS